MMYWFGNGMGGWGYALMGVGIVLFWALVIAGIVALVRYLGGDRHARPEPGTSPEQLLAERFARGEIDEQEYHHRLDVLRGTGAGTGTTSLR